MKLVKFGNGKYGIRKGWFFHSYLDLSCGRFWWYKGSRYFSDCQCDEYIARKAFNALMQKDEVIE